MTYQRGDWDVVLPSVRGFSFSEDEIERFLDCTSPIPLVFDTNMVSACNTNCVYCSTRGGKSDVRFPAERRIPLITDEQYKELIRQFGKLGVRTFFICSNGEPLLNPDRFLDVVSGAADAGVRIITYTNGTTLTPPVLRRLRNAGVSLVLKLESLTPERNDRIILNVPERRKRAFSGYTYGTFHGQNVPSHIIDAFTTFGSDSDMLALETMITLENALDAVDIRQWAYEELGASQFLKHLYNIGYVQIMGHEVRPGKEIDSLVRKRVHALDSAWGMRYPTSPLPDEYSYDARRLMNNLVNAEGVPFRMFGHERGGIYHNSQVVPLSFGFGTSLVVSLLNERGDIDARSYFRTIAALIRTCPRKT